MLVLRSTSMQRGARVERLGIKTLPARRPSPRSSTPSSISIGKLEIPERVLVPLLLISGGTRTNCM